MEVVHEICWIIGVVGCLVGSIIISLTETDMWVRIPHIVAISLRRHLGVSIVAHDTSKWMRRCGESVDSLAWF